MKDTLGRNNRSIPDKECEFCGEIFRPKDSKKRACSRACGIKIRICNPHNKGKGQGWINPKGYREISIDGKSVKEHRYVAELIIDRPLLPTEDVHHINGDKLNNSPENLEVLSHSQHTIQHNNSRSYKKGYKLNLSDDERLRRAASLRLVLKSSNTINKALGGN